MKRVNIILETDLYDKARVVAFIKKKSLSEIVRNALRDWLNMNIDRQSKLALSEKDEERLLRILTNDDFTPIEVVKKSLGL